MPRYHRDEKRRKVAAEIDAEVERAREAETQGGWITYLIRDPTRPDRRGNPAGTPIYVGQTKEFSKRVRSRFMKCEKEATNKDAVEKRVADLLHCDIVVRYEVLERTPTRLTSLISETNWAKRCINRGYDLANRLEEQRVGGEFIDRSGIPMSWLWCFAIQEALEDNIQPELRCTNCDFRLHLDLRHLQTLDEPPKTLRDIMRNSTWRIEPCTQCGGRAKRYVTLRLV
jgi:hypothetical protein